MNKRAISRWTERWYKFKKIFFLKRFWRLKRVDGPQIQLFGCAGLLSVFSFSASLSLFFLPLIRMSLFSLPFPSLSLFYLTFFCVSLFSVQTSISFVICLLSRTLVPYCVFHYLSSVSPFLMWVSSATHNLDKYCCKVHIHTHTRAYVVFLTC